MTRSEIAARSRRLCEIADCHERLRDAVKQANREGLEIRPKAYSQLLRNQSRRRGRAFTCQQAERGPYDAGRRTTLHLPPVRTPGSPGYKKGDCLMCKQGNFLHPDWPGGICPACAGTGRYVSAIMDCREKQSEMEGEWDGSIETEHGGDTGEGAESSGGG